MSTYDYGLSDDPDAHEGDGNIGTGKYGEDPFNAPELADPYTDSKGADPPYGRPAPLKRSGK